MKKIILTSLTIILFLFLTACDTATETATSGPDTKAFIGGDQGLTMQYVEGAPPTEVYDDNKFPFALSLQVENKGEWDISDPTKAKITITGIDPADFNNPVLSKEIGQSLFAKRKDLQGTEIQGSVATITFPDFSYTDVLAGDVQFNLRANVCYAYGTKASTKVCIKDDLLSLDETGCKVNEVKTVSNSGAPVKIQELKESAIATDKLSVTFKIAHVGKGTIYKKDTGCSKVMQDKNKVYLKVETGVTPPVQCSGLIDINGNPKTGPEGYVTLFNNERIITCSQQITTPGNFEKLIDFTLTYDYGEFLDKQITVKHVG